MNPEQRLLTIMPVDETTKAIPKNPYGGRRVGGISLPPYFKPTPYITGSKANLGAKNQPIKEVA